MRLCEMVNRVIYGINKLFHRALFSLISILERLYLWSIGVEFGSNSSFRGWCSFFLYKNYRLKIGDNAQFNSMQYTNHIGINHRCVISILKENASITIGNNFGMSSSSITAFKSIKIGDNVRVGANCVIADGDFHLDDPRVGDPQPIVIEDDVWLGYGVIVMKGVTIGKGSVIGMNSIVTHDIPSNVIAVGSPCKVIKTIK